MADYFIIRVRVIHHYYTLRAEASSGAWWSLPSEEWRTRRKGMKEGKVQEVCMKVTCLLG